MKKALIIASSILLLLAATYTAIWFYGKNKIELSVQQTINNLEKQDNVSYITYKLDVSCFPFLCVDLSDIKAKLKSDSKLSKEGIEVDALKDNKISFETKNILNPHISVKQAQVEIDLTLRNLDNDISTDILLNIDELGLNIKDNKTTIRLIKADIENATANSPFSVLATLGNLTVDFEKSKENNAYAMGYILNNFSIFSPVGKTPIFNIGFSQLVAGFSNVSENLADKASKSLSSSKLIKENVDDIIKNDTSFKIADFRIRANSFKTELKGFANINKDKFLEVNADMAYVPLNNKSPLEPFLKAYGIGKSKDGIYYINVRSKDNLITINKGINIPAPKIQ
tara:strand:- start:10448 stop:11470 length:1023 start_codon:yes stop_codon:yes gene_type:complete